MIVWQWRRTLAAEQQRRHCVSRGHRSHCNLWRLWPTACLHWNMRCKMVAECIMCNCTLLALEKLEMDLWPAACHLCRLQRGGQNSFLPLSSMRTADECNYNHYSIQVSNNTASCVPPVPVLPTYSSAPRLLRSRVMAWPNLFCITSRRCEGCRLQAGGKQWVKFASFV